MPYFPRVEEQPAYRCQGCGGWYRRGELVCCVAHAPGTCCHHGEIRVQPPAGQTLKQKQDIERR